MSHPRILVFQHVPFEGLGLIAGLLEERGANVVWQRWFEQPDAVLPMPEEVDLLIVMGGPMSIHDEAIFPWLKHEKAWLRLAMTVGTPMLGICLGAQLIAESLGAAVAANPVAEIGWYPVEWTLHGQELFGTESCETTVLHWHGETFSLPVGALPLGSSTACAQQGFRHGDTVVGLQFHLEMRAEDVAQLIDHSQAELVDGDWVQDRAGLLGIPDEIVSENRALMARVLDRLLVSRQA